MAFIPENESIISLDMNFSNGGGSHTATVRTVLNAKDLAEGDDLGSLVGSKGGRTTFSDPQLQTLMNNFIETEVSTEQNAVSTTKTRKYEDITSLKLKSHCVVVRGKDSHPKDLGLSSSVNNALIPYSKSNDGTTVNDLNASRPDAQYEQNAKGDEVILPYFGELPNSPITAPSQRFPKREPRLFGGVILIGNIYNEESSVTSTGKKTSLVYQDKKFKPKLSFNEEEVGAYYKNNPDLANYNLKFGYTVKELKSGLAQAGITVVGLPESATDEVLFEESGNLDSILSTVASKFGYYWFVEPFSSGVVRFVNSTSASTLDILDPFQQTAEVQKTYINASFSENFVQPKIVNAFSSTIEKQKLTFEFGSGARTTRFKKVDPAAIIELLEIDASIYKLFYGLWISGKWSDKNFNILAMAAARKYKDKIKWGKWWDAEYPKTMEGKVYEWQEAFGPESRDDLVGKDGKEGSYTGDFPLESGRYIRISSGGKKMTRPTEKGLAEVLKNAYEVCTNSIYCSNKFGEWKARRMNWQNSSLNITGPHKVGAAGQDKISDLDQLSDLQSLLSKIGEPDKKIGDLFEYADSSGSGPYGFIGKIAGNNKVAGERNKKDLDYDWLKPEFVDFIDNGEVFTNEEFIGYTAEFSQNIEHLLSSSITMWDDAMTGTSTIPKTLKAEYTRSKVPTDLPDTEASRKQQEAADERQAKLDSAAERLSEIAERFDIKYYVLKNNGASGNPLNPITLDAKTGTISDILALEKSNISTQQSTEPSLKTSSRTILGVSIPEYKITISGLSIRLGSSGVTTTISESSKKLLPPDQQIIINNNLKVSAFSNISNRMSAGQRNYFGL